MTVFMYVSISGSQSTARRKSIRAVGVLWIYIETVQNVLVACIHCFLRILVVSHESRSKQGHENEEGKRIYQNIRTQQSWKILFFF